MYRLDKPTKRKGTYKSTKGQKIMLKFKDYFYGNKISEYGLKNGFVDYHTLAKSFDSVLNNDIMSALEMQGFYFEIENGLNIDYDSEEVEELEYEIYQYYIISNDGAKIIKEFTDDPIFYCSELDMYIWGVCHYGTSWDYVLTNIPCGVEE